MWYIPLAKWAVGLNNPRPSHYVMGFQPEVTVLAFWVDWLRVSSYHHLPKIASAGVVKYDTENQFVEPTDTMGT